MLTIPYYVVLLFTSSVLLGNLAIIAWSRRSVPGSLIFSWMLLGAALWSFGAGMENLAATQADKIVWTKLEYIGVLSVAPLTYFMIRKFLDHTSFSLPHLASVLSVPVLVFILAITNEWHGLIWSGFEWGDPTYNILIYKRGIGYWLNITYIFGMLAYNFFILIAAMRGANQIRKKQIIVLMLGMLAPWVTATVYVTTWLPTAYLDITPVGFFFTGLIILIGFSYYRLFNLLPIASEKLLETMSDGVILINRQNRLDYISSAAKTLLDLPSLNVNDLSGNLAQIFPFLSGDTLSQSSISIEKAGGQVTTLKIERIPLAEKNRKVIGMMIVLHDLTKVLALEKELHQAEVDASRINERKRIGRDLHDLLNQSLHSIVFSAELAQRQLKNGNLNSLEPVLAHLREGAVQARKEIRLLLYEMQLEVPVKRDLITSINHRLDAVERRAGIKGDIIVIPEGSAPIRWDENLYGLLMEALNNVTRHANASQISIIFELTQESLCVKVKDNGHGFDLTESLTGGLGIQNMHERATLLNGQLKIHSSPGTGTEILLCLKSHEFYGQSNA